MLGNFYHIGRRSGAGSGGFDDWFGVAADMYTNGNTFNGDDAIVLYHIDGSDTVTMDVVHLALTVQVNHGNILTDGCIEKMVKRQKLLLL